MPVVTVLQREAEKQTNMDTIKGHYYQYNTTEGYWRQALSPGIGGLETFLMTSLNITCVCVQQASLSCPFWCGLVMSPQAGALDRAFSPAQAGQADKSMLSWLCRGLLGDGHHLTLAQNNGQALVPPCCL